MGSLFGRGDFGDGLYGVEYSALSGSIEMSVTLSGHFRNPVNRLSATLVSGVRVVDDARLNAERALEGGLDLQFTLSGDLHKADIVSLSGGMTLDVVVNPLIDGAVYRGLSGKVAAYFGMSARKPDVVVGLKGSLKFSVSMESKEYIGYMWEAQHPPAGSWSPTSVSDGDWAPIPEVNGIWVNVG